MYSKPTTPLSIGQVLDGSFRLMGSGWKGVWVLALLGALAANAGAIYQVIVQAILSTPPTSLKLAVINGVVTIGGIILSVVIYAAMTIRLNRLAANEPTAGELWAALRRLPGLIGLGICYSLVLAASSIPTAAYLLMSWPNIGVTEVVIASVLSAPFWLYAVSLYLSQTILLLERLGPIKSLNASHRLIWGKWWRTATILTVGGIIILVTYLIAGFAGALGGAVMSGGEAILATTIAMVVVIAAISMFIGPYLVSLLLVIYWDLKLRKEGGDLAARAEAV